MAGTMGLWRLALVFALTSIGSMTWFQGLKALDPSGDANKLSGLASNAGLLVFGSYLIFLALRRRSLRADSWRSSLVLALVTNLSQPVWLVFADRPLPIVCYSILLFVINTLLTSQITALTMAESASFAHDRRGGSLGYGLAYGTASTLLPWLATALAVLCAVALLALPYLAGLFAQNNAPKPQPERLQRVISDRWRVIITSILLFALLSASARVYENFSGSLLGTLPGVGGVALLVLFEWLLLPRLDARHSQGWILIALMVWPVAYWFLLQDGWLPAVAIACISVNCCGQTVLQEQLQSASKPGSSQLQATMAVIAASSAAVVSYAALHWQISERGPLWILGLIASTLSLAIALPVLLLNCTLHRPDEKPPAPSPDA